VTEKRDTRTVWRYHAARINRRLVRPAEASTLHFTSSPAYGKKTLFFLSFPSFLPTTTIRFVTPSLRMLFHPLFPLWLSAVAPVLAQQPGSFETAGNTLVSAMMVRFRDRITYYTPTSFYRCFWAVRTRSTFWTRSKAILSRSMAILYMRLSG
jgi:hypothetical protein